MESQRVVNVLPLSTGSVVFVVEFIKGPIPGGFTSSRCRISLGPIQYLLKLCHAMAHAGMHVGFRAFDMVMKVVTEELDVGNRCRGRRSVCKVARKENECDVSEIIAALHSGKMPNF